MDNKPDYTGYKAVCGISWPDGERTEAGEPVAAALLEKAKWLISKGSVKR